MCKKSLTFINNKQVKDSPWQMLQGLPIALAQLKASNTSENLPSEICQIIYSLYQAKQITKKVCNNLMNSMRL